MNSLLAYMEFTSFSNENPEGYDDFPDFNKDIWPLFLNNKDAIEEIYVLKESKIFKREINDFEKLGPMIALTNRELKIIEHKAFYGGHLDIYFKTRNKNFLKELTRLWKKSEKININLECLKLEKNLKLLQEISLFKDLYIVIVFGHDADPMYLISTEENLKIL